MPTDQDIHAPRRVRKGAARSGFARLVFGLAFLAAIAIVGTFLFQAGFFSIFSPRAEPGLAQVPAPAQTTVKNATVGGFDKERLPFTIDSLTSVNRESSKNLVDLTHVNATFRRAGGSSMTLSSQTGIYDSATQILNVSQNVVLGLKGSYTATMDAATINVQAKSLSATVPVVATFSGGIIHANGMEIGNNGKTIRFVKGVKTRLNSATESDTPATDPTTQKGDSAP